MKRKVANEDLMIGMYVVELDRPWDNVPFESPFELQGFTIANVEELEKVRKLCGYVYIDPTLGVGAKRYLEDDMPMQDIFDVMHALPQHESEVYRETTTFSHELDTASQVLDDCEVVYARIEEAMAKGGDTDMETIKSAMTDLVGSVIRNPAAVSWLVRLKRGDSTTYSHSIAVCVLALAVGRFLGLPRNQMENLGLAALLQDIGKIRLPEELLTKTGPLNSKEREILRRHVMESVQMLEQARNFPKQVVQTVSMHHERHDGSGYPRGLKGDDVSMPAVVCALADSYEAMVNDRPYRRAKTSYEALMELYGKRDTEFAGALVEQFIQCIGIFPIGSFVQLNTKEIAVVIKRNQIQQLKPRVMILVSADGKRKEEPESMDLAAQYLEPGEVPRIISKVVNPKRFDIDPHQFFA
jgi:putative nucleotidyltransferase with HDIG domain